MKLSLLTVYRSVDIIIIINKPSQVLGYYSSMLFLTKHESNLIVHGLCSPSHYNGGEGGDLI